jgi:hypothetical protein
MLRQEKTVLKLVNKKKYVPNVATHTYHFRNKYKLRLLFYDKCPTTSHVIVANTSLRYHKSLLIRHICPRKSLLIRHICPRKSLLIRHICPHMELLCYISFIFHRLLILHQLLIKL